jgi:hypothetical protein
MAEELVERYCGRGKLVFEEGQAPADVFYEINEYQRFAQDHLGRESPTSHNRRGRVTHAVGHPSWHPIVSLHRGPFTLVMANGQKLKVSLTSPEGSAQATGDFF